MSGLFGNIRCRSGRPRLRALPAAIVCVAAILSGCSDAPSASGAAAERVYKVEVAPTDRQDVSVHVNAVGTVYASAQAEIRPMVDGIVDEIFYERGSTVERGQMLVRLDDRKAVARVQLSKATLDNARARMSVADRNLHRAQRLFDEELISLEEFESIEADSLAASAAVREQEAALVLAERQLEDYHLRAPFSGIVGARLVDTGNYVESGTVLVVLMKTDPVEIDFRVPDRHHLDVKSGTEIRVRATSDDYTAPGMITFVDPRVDQNTRMIGVRAAVPNAESRLRHGQFVEVSVLAGVRERQLVIPEQAILYSSGNTSVFVVEEGHAKRRRVEIGERLPPGVEILSGLDEGATVIVGGQHRLSDGAAVEIVTPTTGGA